jgi:hypothetical protein
MVLRVFDLFHVLVAMVSSAAWQGIKRLPHANLWAKSCFHHLLDVTCTQVTTQKQIGCRCASEKGDDARECKKYAKYYRSLCPGDWVRE